MAEHTVVLDEEYEGALEESGMTAESALIDKIQPYLAIRRNRLDRELLVQAKRAQEKDPEAFAALAEQEVVKPEIGAVPNEEPLEK